jgi:hypothetical protein
MHAYPETPSHPIPDTNIRTTHSPYTTSSSIYPPSSLTPSLPLPFISVLDSWKVLYSIHLFVATCLLRSPLCRLAYMPLPGDRLLWANSVLVPTSLS